MSRSVPSTDSGLPSLREGHIGPITPKGAEGEFLYSLALSRKACVHGHPRSVNPSWPGRRLFAGLTGPQASRRFRPRTCRLPERSLLTSRLSCKGIWSGDHIKYIKKKKKKKKKKKEKEGKKGEGGGRKKKGLLVYPGRNDEPGLTFYLRERVLFSVLVLHVAAKLTAISPLWKDLYFIFISHQCMDF